MGRCYELRHGLAVVAEKDREVLFITDRKWISAFGGNLGKGEAKLKPWGPHGGLLDLRDPIIILALSDQKMMKRFKLDGIWTESINFPGGNPGEIIVHCGHLFVNHLGDNWPVDRNAAGYLLVLGYEVKVVGDPGGALREEGGALERENLGSI